MGFRFRRSVRILPGVKINLSGSDASVSLGGRGFHYTIGPKGTRVTAGIPGTGMSWTQYSPHSKTQPSVPNVLDPSPHFDPVPPSSHVELEAIENASAGEINAHSTSDLAPILNSANRTVRIATFIQLLSVLLFVGALIQINHLWLGLSALYATVFVPLAIFLDRYRRSVKVIYDSQGVVARITEALAVAFTELSACKVIWSVLAEGSILDWKRNAGASSLIQRKRVNRDISALPTSGRQSQPTQPQSPPLELKPPAPLADHPTSITDADTDTGEPLDLRDVSNVRWVQSRLRDLGFLRSNGGVNWDGVSRSALRDFKATNGIGSDDKWDYRTEELLASGTALRAEQTFVGSWSEIACDARSKPDLVINSRRATSAAGGICEFLNVKTAGPSWSIGTTCSNAGERWSATIHLAMADGNLAWTGRDGTVTEYVRCR
jgi:hypothetical protein